MEYMATLEDNAFDLAIVDPPYGIEKGFSATSRVAKYGQMKTVNDMKPKHDYFSELERVSANRIVWGWNHMSDMLPPTKEFIFWYKHQPVKTYSDGEIAWTSFDKTAKCFDHPYWGSHNADNKRIHPTQKPIALYKWLLKNYAEPGMRILDTHLGSGSSAIAAHYGGFDFVGCELDPEYYKAACERFDRETRQIDMFQRR
jgi:site-specific DNA-methyltransferase (adenine-specific)